MKVQVLGEGAIYPSKRGFLVGDSAAERSDSERVEGRIKRKSILTYTTNIRIIYKEN